MAGAPIGLKDLIDMEGLPTTAGSIIDKDKIADEDALLAQKIRQAGGVTLGKLNLHEFAFGPTGHNPHYGDQKNPWDTERVTGGSSGGSGNSVATGQVSIAIGSDTGGSIRIPASLCGVHRAQAHAWACHEIELRAVVLVARFFRPIGPICPGIARS